MEDKERAKKLAAAKKKLKAYKSGGDKRTNNIKENIEESTTDVPKLENYFNNKDSSSDLFLVQEQENSKVECELITKQDEKVKLALVEQDDPANLMNKPFQENNSNTITSVSINVENEKDESTDNINASTNSSEFLKTIELLISEKADISKESSKFQISCKEKDFEIEEFKTRLKGANRRIEELEQFYFSEQKKNAGMMDRIQNLEIELNKYKNQSEEFSDHVEELKRELSADKTRITEMENEIKEKSSQLNLNNIKINQISDENNITIDNRIETLTQTKFMYEQQIVDLQNMVQQLRAEKEQSNQQYQNYVQHLNKDIAALTDKNSDLSEENTKLSARERDLVDHIGTLEKEIQQNIVKSEHLRQNMTKISTDSEEKTLEDNKLQIQSDQFKKLEEELKKVIEEKSEEINKNGKIIEIKTQEIIQLQERISILESERPNDAKLLASIESDKVAASRAMTQNSDLRKQLDELQLKLIELTNDKMELTNTLDSEIFNNRQIRENFEEMQNQIKLLSDQLYFKDEEMCRLSTENNELEDKLQEVEKGNEQLRVCLLNFKSENKVKKSENQIEQIGSLNENEDPPSCSPSDSLYLDQTDIQEIEKSEPLLEDKIKRKDSDTLSLPTSEAMWRLEERFKKLMGEVADLTDEKQQLEHLVLQLQGETETIGEYIALYQSQRKILKQKEYERDAQLKRLLSEREDLRNKALQLDALIKQIGLKSNVSNNSNLTEMLTNQREVNEKLIGIDKNLTNGHYENEQVVAQTEFNRINDFDIKHDYQQQQQQQPHNHNNNEAQKYYAGHITESDSKKIIDRIQSLVSDLKKDKESFPILTTSVDHCACCSGNLETI